jgi:hypothetical protein
LVEVDVLAEGASHERDSLQMTVEQETGTGMFSNAVHEVSRAHSPAHRRRPHLGEAPHQRPAHLAPYEPS